METVKAFVRLAFSPLRWGWNLISAAVPGAGAILAWWRHYQAVGWVLFAIAVVLLLIVAGIRLQYRLLASQRSCLTWIDDRTHFSEGVITGRSTEINLATGEVVGSKTLIHPDQPYRVWGLMVKNDPPGHSHEAVIRDAFIEMKFFHEGELRTPFLETPGLWHSDQAESSPGDAGLRRRTISPNAEPAAIEVVILTTHGLFVASHNSWPVMGKPAAGPLEALNTAVREKHRLPSGEVVFGQVTVNGTGMRSPLVRWVKFEPGESNTRFLALASEPSPGVAQSGE